MSHYLFEWLLQRACRGVRVLIREHEIRRCVDERRQFISIEVSPCVIGALEVQHAACLIRSLGSLAVPVDELVRTAMRHVGLPE
jgi:hypothetical protein